jgi:hypothetical protein
VDNDGIKSSKKVKTGGKTVRWSLKMLERQVSRQKGAKKMPVLVVPA